MTYYKCIRCGATIGNAGNALGLCTDTAGHAHASHDWRIYDFNFNPVDDTGGTTSSARLDPTQAEINAKQAAYLQYQAGHANVVPPKTTREDVFARFDALDPDFLTALANIGGHAAEKYGSWEQYKNSRLEGGRGPINHALTHVTMYRQEMPYDRFDGDPRWHLVAAAYNLMMEYWYSLHPEVKP